MSYDEQTHRLNMMKILLHLIYVKIQLPQFSQQHLYFSLLFHFTVCNMYVQQNVT